MVLLTELIDLFSAPLPNNEEDPPFCVPNLRLDQFSDYPPTMLIFCTTEFSESILAGSSRYWNEETMCCLDIETQSNTIISTIVTEPLERLDTLIDMENTQYMIQKNAIIFLNCLENDFEGIILLLSFELLQPALRALIDMYCEFVKHLRDHGKLVILPILLPIANTAGKRILRRRINCRILERLSYLNVEYHVKNYDIFVQPAARPINDVANNVTTTSIPLEVLSHKLLCLRDVAIQF